MFEGMLLKKGRDNKTYLKRKFVLSEREFTLTYYNKEDVSFQQRQCKQTEFLKKQQLAEVRSRR